MPNTPFPYRLFGGFRLLLAVLVFIQHALANLAPQAFENFLRPVEAGSIAVLIFFVLSGFIVTEAAVYFYRERPAAFIVNRLLRIVPSYVIALLITLGIVVLLIQSGTEHAIAGHVGGIPNLTAEEFLLNAAAVFPGGKWLLDRTGTRPILDIAWALRVELAFYAVLFLALVVSVRTRLRIETVLTTIGVLTLALWLVTDSAHRHSMIQFVPFFVFGAAVFFAVTVKAATGRAVAIGLTVISAVLSGLALQGHEAMVFAADPSHNRSAATGLFVALSLVWMGLLTVPARSVSPAVLWWDKQAGEATYPLYLLHTAMSAAASALIAERGWSALIFGLVLSLAASILAVRTYEAAIGRLRSRVRGREI